MNNIRVFKSYYPFLYGTRPTLSAYSLSLLFFTQLWSWGAKEIDTFKMQATLPKNVSEVLSWFMCQQQVIFGIRKWKLVPTVFEEVW